MDESGPLSSPVVVVTAFVEALNCRDRHDPTHYIEILEFDSAEDAALNSSLPETNATHEVFVHLCTDGPRFIDLDVVRDEQFRRDNAGTR